MYIVHQVMLLIKSLLLHGQIQVTHVHQVMLVNKPFARSNTAKNYVFN